MGDRVSSGIRVCVGVVLFICVIAAFLVINSAYYTEIGHVKELKEEGVKVYAEVVDIDFYTSEHTSVAIVGKVPVASSRDRDYQRIKLEYVNKDNTLEFGVNGISPSHFIEAGDEIAVYYDASDVNRYYVDISDIKK